MSTGHLVGYVGGLAVALGVGTAVWVSAPTASADASSASSHSAGPSGTATSARAPQRANAVAAMKPAPRRKVAAPASSVTLLMAASGTADTRRMTVNPLQPSSTTRNALTATSSGSTPPAADTIPIDSGHNLVIDTTGDWSTGFTTHVSVHDTATGSQTGTTLDLAGRIAQDPLLDTEGRRVVVATSTEISYSKYASQVAVFDTNAGTPVGTTMDFDGSPRVELVGDTSLALISTYVYDANTGGATHFTVIDTAAGAKVGAGVTLEGSPWNSPAVSAHGANLLVIAVNQDLFAGSSTVNAAVLNTATGTQAGHTVSLDGALWGDPLVNDDGTHVLLTASIGGATHVAVIDAVSGEQSGDTLDLQGSAGYVLPAADRVHVLITADDGESTHIAVVDATTGDQADTTFTLTGRIGPPLLSADGIHALFTASTADSTQVAVLDTTTGKQTGTTVTLTGRVAGPWVNADGIHALFAASTGDSTRVVVVDSTSGEQTGTAVDLAGAMSYTLGDAGGTHVLVVTSAGGSTQFTSFDSATGQQAAVPLSFTGDLVGWPSPSTAADGTHALFIFDEAATTRLVLIDITTGTETGTGLTLPGDPGIPIVSDDGNHSTIVTRVAATTAHGSSTRVAVIDTTTGNQVGVTTRLTGTPAALPQLSADGHHVMVTTFAGLTANLDTTTGTATTRIARAPWGLDLEAFALTPLGRVVMGIEVAVGTAYLVMVQFVLFGFLWLGSIFSQAPTHQVATTPAAQLQY